MSYYPIFLSLKDRECLVVGAGEVGRRKIEGLVRGGAGRVVVVDTAEPAGEMAELAAMPEVDFQVRGFEDEDLDGKWLVIASTSSEEVNWRISNLCRERGILCNIVDQPEKCSFIVPAVVQQGDLTLAVSTGGSSPAMAKRIRRDLQSAFGEEYARMLLVMSRLRPLVLGLDRPTSENTKVFQAVVASGLMDALARADAADAAEELEAVLPQELHPRIPEVLDAVC